MKNLKRSLKIILFLLFLQQSNSLLSSPTLLNFKKNSKLHRAIEESHKKDDMIIVWNCKSIEADLETVNKKGETPLMLAVHLDDFPLVKFLVDKKGANVNYINEKDGYSILAEAIGGDNKIVNFLIDKGADILFVVESEDNNVLHYSALLRRVDAIIKILNLLKTFKYIERIKYLSLKNLHDSTPLKLLNQFIKDQSEFEDLLNDCLDQDFNPDGTWAFDENGQQLDECVYGIRS